MVKWLKRGFFLVALVSLLFIIRYQFTSSDSWSTWNLPLSGKMIVLDPGHGGMDGGALSKSGVIEKEIALQISEQLRDYLQEAGALVIMTREDDQDLAGNDQSKAPRRKTRDLMRRVEIVNESGADLFISIHMNAIPQSQWSGAQTFYHRAFPENEILAKFIQDQARENLGNTTRIAKPIHNIYLLKHAEIPGVLFEAGFLSNPGEAALLQTKEYQEKVAVSIYQGIMRFYTNETPPKE